MPTIRHVARDAGVGVGTVSRGLAGHPGVSPATRQAVEAAIRRLNYRPGPIARALSNRRANVLEVVVPLLGPDFYVEVLRGIEAAIASTDYALVIRTVERAGDHRRVFAEVGARDRADAVVIVSLYPLSVS